MLAFTVVLVYIAWEGVVVQTQNKFGNKIWV